MSRPRTFDTRLEALLDAATPEQLQRMHELSGFLLRRAEKHAVPPAPAAPKRKKAENSNIGITHGVTNAE